MELFPDVDPLGEVADVPVVVVSGAAGTLGRAVVEAIVARGARVSLTDQSIASLDNLGDDISASTVLVLAADLRDSGAPEVIFSSTFEVAGRIDAYVHVAGIEGPVGGVDAVEGHALLDVFDLNVFAAFRTLAALLPYFRTSGSGRVVNIASGAGLAGVEFLSPYSSSKHALVGLTRSAARELAADGISVNAVCPGCVESPMMERLEAALEQVPPEQSHNYRDAIPARRYAEPAEIANVVAYLALEAPLYLTGAAIPVDGALRA